MVELFVVNLVSLASVASPADHPLETSPPTLQWTMSTASATRPVCESQLILFSLLLGSYTTALRHSCFSSSSCKRLTFSTFSALCDHTGADRHDCNANEAAGVICETREVAAVPSVCNRPGVICLLPGQGDGPAGPTRGHSTRGNVYVGGKPVCDDGWSNNSAAVICRELGWETGWATKESYFGAVHADFGLSHVQCNVQDRRLSACRF